MLKVLHGTIEAIKNFSF